MDIFQGPFRVVFEDSPEQLPLLLDKLRRQYEVAETAQVKHAVLRALFPVLKALVEEAGEEERQVLLDEALIAIALPCISQGSTATLETIILVNDTLAYFATHYLRTFGKSTLHLILSNILFTIEDELDFVEVYPLIFIEKNLTPEIKPAWEELQRYMDKEADTFVQRPVDVECCLDILLKMMQHLQKGDEHPRSEPVEIDEKTEVEDQDEVVKKRREDEEEAVKLIDTAFLVTVSLLSCTDRGIRNKVLNNCIPAFFGWEVKRASYVMIVDGMEKPNRRGIWCKMVWDRSCQIFALPATNLLRLEVYGIFARLFDYYFGYVDDDDTRKGVETVAVTLNVGMDLRYEEKFFEIVQSGLKSSDSLARKYSVYILKRVIDYTQKNLASTQGASWTKYFIWSVDANEDWETLWDDFFLLYDIMHEPVSHLVEPVLPRFDLILRKPNPSTPHLHSTWWALLFYRGFQNDTVSVKRRILEYVLSIESPEALNVLGCEFEFIFSALLTTLDNTALYSVPTLGTMVSPFGEMVRTFCGRLIKAYEKDEDRKQFLRQLIHHVFFVTGSSIPILYIMEALAEATPMPVWGPEDLKSLRALAEKHRNFQKNKSKVLLRKLALASFLNLADTKSMQYSDVSKILSTIINERPIHLDWPEYDRVCQWFTKFDKEGEKLVWLESNLKERLAKFMKEHVAADEPFNLARNQANIISRMSAFLLKDYPEKVVSLFEPVFDQLKSTESSIALFNKLLVLVDSLWTELGAADDAFDVKKIGSIQECASTLITRAEAQFLEIGGEKDTDEDYISVFLCTFSRILKGADILKSSERKKILKMLRMEAIKYFDFSKNGEKTAENEFLKFNHLRVLAIVYDVASQHELFDIPCDTTLVTLLSDLQLRKASDMVYKKSWGDTMAGFIKAKWKCIHDIGRYAYRATELGHDLSRFDVSAAFERCVEELENASELCAEAVLECLELLISLPWEKSVESITRCIDSALEIVNENMNNSKSFPGIILATVNMIFQAELLKLPNLNQEEGPMKKAFSRILKLGDIKPHIVTQCVSRCYDFWRLYTAEAISSLALYKNEVVQMLVFGPLRDREEQKIDSAIVYKLEGQDIGSDVEGTVELNFTQRDYLVRVQMNDLILHLDPNNAEHATLVNALLLELVTMATSETLLNPFIYINQIEHRIKMRLWCSFLVSSRFITRESADHYITLLLDAIKREMMVSVRCYIEWTLMRIFIAYPEKLVHLYRELDNMNHKAHVMISILTIAFPLGDTLPDSEHLDTYFSEIFLHVIPWMTSNHFTIRLFAQWAILRNWKSCENRNRIEDVSKNAYLRIIYNFVQQNSDCIRFQEKMESAYYMNGFSPLQDYNIEFIFREMLALNGVTENERIAARAFEKVNPTPSAACPFRNADRKVVYASTGPSELFELSEDGDAETRQASVTEDAGYQKKIVPWEMMLHTDIDLSRQLVQKKRPRNDLIVVASLIDRIPNLAGLCRTCEIFNASLLTVHSIKIKDDTNFTAVSVASEKWMPMIEVREPDVATFLKEKKEQGYMLCGLEQTTNSVSLSEMKFPEKCVIILGKEKEGIPAQLLQFLDQTIEIPQFGITRSLNVHVSGAIAIYEYTKQMSRPRRHANVPEVKVEHIQ